MAKKITQLYTDHPITLLDAGDLIEGVDDTGGTPVSGAFKASQLMFNRYKIGVTVSSNDLVVAVTHEDGVTPSADRPLYFKIGTTLRAVTSSLTFTIADGTNWFGLSPEWVTLSAPLFVYVVWDSNSSVVALSCARIPFGRVVSDFLTTTTSPYHLYNFTNFTSTDDVANIGYFEAILGVTAGFLWTVPTFSGVNLRHEPTFVSRELSYTPLWIASGTQPAIGNGTLVGTAKIKYDMCFASINMITGGTSTYGTGTYTWSLPFPVRTITNGNYMGLGRAFDNSATTYYTGAASAASAATAMAVQTHGATSVVSQTVPFTWATSDQLKGQLEYGIRQ